VRLLEYFVRTVSAQLGQLQADYAALERQTQKLEADVRVHIAFEESLKIDLNSRIRSAEKHKREAKNYKSQLDELTFRISQQSFRNLSQLSTADRPRTQPKYIREFEKVLRIEESPVKRADLSRRWNAKYAMDEDDAFGREKSEFNPEVSNCRNRSLEG
jgi:hypothetical protein